MYNVRNEQKQKWKKLNINTNGIACRWIWRFDVVRIKRPPTSHIHTVNTLHTKYMCLALAYDLFFSYLQMDMWNFTAGITS